MIDVGTGDGHFVYQSARRNPETFYIGIDANSRALDHVSEKIYRRAAKGGLANVLFVQAAVEDLPSELDGVANQVQVNFPWGSLLRVLATPDSLLAGIRRLCATSALLEVIIGLDAERDRSALARLQVPDLSIAYIDNVLTPHYRRAGFEIVKRGERLPSEWPAIETSWARRLKGNANRSLVYLIARAV